MQRDGGPWVLVAENNPVERALICSCFESLGVFPDSSAHGREILDACRRRAYDVIFLACRMPMMDGFAAAREVRAREAGKGKRAYIVGMAENHDEDWAGPGIPQGMDALIIKPLDIEVVRGLLRTAARDR